MRRDVHLQIFRRRPRGINSRSFRRDFRFPAMTSLTQVVASLVMLLLFVLQSPSVLALHNQQQGDSLTRATEWLVSQQGDDGGFVGFTGASDPGATVDGLMALAAARAAGLEVDLAPAIHYLEENALVYAQTGPGQAAKLALGLLAAGADPRDIAGVNPLAIVEVSAESGMIGQGPFEHSLGVLALVAAGSAVPAAAVEAFASTQAEDGAWAFDGTTTAGAGDTNTTAMALQALVAAGHSDDEMVDRGLDYLLTLQTESGGFVFQPGGAADANSTALCLQAMLALANPELTEAKGKASTALLQFQNSSGAFRYQDEPPNDNLLATTQAIPAVAGFALPIPAVVPSATPVGSPAAG
jgi:prenyltransferase beta subunit